MLMINPAFTDLSINEQLDLLALSKSSYYYKSVADKEKDQNIANHIY